MSDKKVIAMVAVVATAVIELLTIYYNKN